jgi:hypothetical protein
MAYVVGPTNNAPHFLGGELIDFAEKVPSLERRAEVAQVFDDGTRLLQADEIPTHLLLDRPAKRFRDIFQSQDGILVISPALHDLLQQLDPGVHQFSPISLDHIPAAGPRFALNVHFKQDSIVDAKSSVRRNAGMPDNRNVMYINFRPEGVDLVVDSSRLASVNLWRERRYPSSLLLSDRLHSEIVNRQLKFFPVIRVKEIPTAE